jgi:hypothetical protein
MKFYQTIKKGEYHPIFCEDYSLINKVTNDLTLCAVMDGSTMGTESHFSSTLIAKILRKIIKEKIYLDFINKKNSSDLEEELKYILKSLFIDLKEVKNKLLLDTNELLSTLGIFLVNIKLKNGIIFFVGDGVLCINNKMIVLDHNNKPDYLGYHLTEDFEIWFKNHKQVYYIEEIRDVSISTDGILSFNLDNQKTELTESEIIHKLLIDKFNFDKAEMLDTKIKFLEKEYNLMNTDDLSIIRVIDI